MSARPQIRRCFHLQIEPVSEQVVSLQSILSGGNGLQARRSWRALAPHLPAPVALTDAMVLRLGQIDRDLWMPCPVLEDDMAVAALLTAGLLLSVEDDESEAARADMRLRRAGWFGPAAVLHWQSRWGGMDSVDALQSAGLQTAQGLRRHLGPPPPATVAPAGMGIALPRIAEDAFDARLQARSTCRNFDTGRMLPLEDCARLLRRCLGATGELRVEVDSTFIKKNAPSAGGLHPTEAYVLVQHVEGIAPGLYHYHPVQHVLTPALAPASGHAPLDPTLAVRMVSGQHWFAGAHVLVILAPRFTRTYWKYRNHAKAYRAVLLDVGHLSQLLMTCATEQGLGAFVTAAVNERDIEQALGMDPMQQSPLAICGFGWRSARMRTSEFDPAGKVWEQVG